MIFNGESEMKRLLVVLVAAAIAGCNGSEGDTGLDFDENDPEAAAQALKSENEFARQKAASALGEMGSEAQSKIPDLLAVAKNETEGHIVRAEAIHAIGKIGTTDQATLDALQELSKHKSSRPVRDAAKEVLAQLGQ